MTLSDYRQCRTERPTDTMAWYCARCDEIIPVPVGTKPTACPRCGSQNPVFVGYMLTRPKRKARQHEAQEQAKLFLWAEQNTIVHPELSLLYHIPNGGKRDAAEAAHLKRQGVKAGVPDIHLPVARGGFNSLYIELKVEGNTITDNQERWLRELSKAGNATIICYGAKSAAEAITDYLALSAT